MFKTVQLPLAVKIPYQNFHFNLKSYKVQFGEVKNSQIQSYLIQISTC